MGAECGIKVKESALQPLCYGWKICVFFYSDYTEITAPDYAWYEYGASIENMIHVVIEGRDLVNNYVIKENDLVNSFLIKYFSGDNSLLKTINTEIKKIREPIVLLAESLKRLSEKA